MSEHNAVVLTFTGQAIGTMALYGGSGHWTADPNRLRQASYLVCVRNRRRDHEEWAAKDHLPHGTAFLIAKVTGVAESPRKPNQKPRHIVSFDEYAEIEISDAWGNCTDGQRFPVAYLSEETAQKSLGIDFDSPELEWKRLSNMTGYLSELQGDEQLTVPVESEEESSEKNSPDTPELTVEQAKQGLATHFGVLPEQIDINVRF